MPPALLHVSMEGTVQGQSAAPLPASRCQQSTAAATSTASPLILPWLQVDLGKALEHDTLLVVLLNAVSPSCPTSTQQAGGDDACRWGDCASCTAARGLARGICLRLLRGGFLDARLSHVEAALTAAQEWQGGNGNGKLRSPFPLRAPAASRVSRWKMPLPCQGIFPVGSSGPFVPPMKWGAGLSPWR